MDASGRRIETVLDRALTPETVWNASLSFDTARLSYLLMIAESCGPNAPSPQLSVLTHSLMSLQLRPRPLLFLLPTPLSPDQEFGPTTLVSSASVSILLFLLLNLHFVSFDSIQQ